MMMIGLLLHNLAIRFQATPDPPPQFDAIYKALVTYTKFWDTY